jgi:hypothetical protein
MQVQNMARVKENATFNATKWMCVGFKRNTFKVLCTLVKKYLRVKACKRILKNQPSRVFFKKNCDK